MCSSHPPTAIFPVQGLPPAPPAVANATDSYCYTLSKDPRAYQLPWASSPLPTDPTQPKIRKKAQFALFGRGSQSIGRTDPARIDGGDGPAHLLAGSPAAEALHRPGARRQSQHSDFPRFRMKPGLPLEGPLWVRRPPHPARGALLLETPSIQLLERLPWPAPLAAISHSRPKFQAKRLILFPLAPPPPPSRCARAAQVRAVSGSYWRVRLWSRAHFWPRRFLRNGQQTQNLSRARCTSSLEGARSASGGAGVRAWAPNLHQRLPGGAAGVWSSLCIPPPTAVLPQDTGMLSLAGKTAASLRA